jgi:hypothetical protein
MPSLQSFANFWFLSLLNLWDAHNRSEGMMQQRFLPPETSSDSLLLVTPADAATTSDVNTLLTQANTGAVDHTQTLLRAADKATAAPDTLLRPAAHAQTAVPDELLRANPTASETPLP